MGDSIKLPKDKRHRSSSSIVASVLDGTRSERKLDIRESIIEVHDQFAEAEARCNDLQEKLDLVKGLKRKKKLKKRSVTRIPDPLVAEEEVPFISVRTQPKKRMVQQAARRIRRIQEPSNPIRGYVDQATVEQHHMIGQVRGLNPSYRPQSCDITKDKHVYPNQNQRFRQSRADGDSVAAGGLGRASRTSKVAKAVSDDDFSGNTSTHFEALNPDMYGERTALTKKVPVDDLRKKVNQALLNRRRHVPRDIPFKHETPVVQSAARQRATGSQQRRKRPPSAIAGQFIEEGVREDNNPVVEVFYKNRTVRSDDLTRCNSRDIGDHLEMDSSREPNSKEKVWLQHNRRLKYRSRRYEQPTVASQMKQSNARFCAHPHNSSSAIPFIISRSCAPSHNIGVNIQQVLNGLKTQQPLSGIPLTIAHHMGLGHIPHYETRNVQPSLDNREMNAIRLGQRLLRLPSYKFMSYNRLLTLYRESDGMVSRFLRSIDRPQRFITSMYNLATREAGSTVHSTYRFKTQDAKVSLAAYAALYREYEKVDKMARETHDPELEERKEELIRQLASREEQIRKVVNEYRKGNEDGMPLRASASTAEDTLLRFSSMKLHLGDVV